MRKAVCSIVMVLAFLLLQTGCATDRSQLENSGTLSGSASVSAAENDSVQLVRTMMRLDYASMPVAEFNEKIQQICADDDTNVFEVISNVYDHFTVYDETGGHVGPVYNDPGLETFMRETLAYSAQEIFGEPVHMGNIAYMTMPGMTALELYQQKQQMQADEWERYFDDNIQEISIFPVLSYTITADIPDMRVIVVSERDARITDMHAAIVEYLLTMDAELVMAENLESNILAEFERLSTAYSDDKMTVTCAIQSLERDLG